MLMDKAKESFISFINVTANASVAKPWLLD